MSMLNHLSAFADRAVRAGMPALPRYAVSLIDRASGRPHAICGIPLVLLTTSPAETAAEMMRNRDPSRWDARVEPMPGKEVRA